MKLSEILDDSDQYELMTKLLNREGFSTAYTQLKSGGRQGQHSIRSNAMLKVALGPSFGTKQGRVQLKNDVWHFVIMSGQGHILAKGSGDEQEALDFFTDYTMRKVSEGQDDEIPMVWLLAAKEKAKRKRVSISAAVEMKGLTFIQGEIMNVDLPGMKVGIYAYGRMWILPMRSEDDKHYTLKKDPQSDFYWVNDIEHDEDL